MISVEDWAEIRRLHRAEGLAINEIVRRSGLARNTVRAALRSDRPPIYERAAKGSIVDAVDGELRALLAQHPRMPATVLAERIGWMGGMTVFKQRVRQLRPLFVPPDPVQRTIYRPGELAQWDLWFPEADIPIGFDLTARLPVVVGVAGYSRWITGRMIPSREAHDILAGKLECLLELGGVPRAAVWDGEGALVSRHGRVSKPTRAFDAFRGVLGMGVVICKPGDPEAKGLVERANGYLATSFLPGRTFTGVDDFNAQLTAWLVKANHRHHRVLGCRPADRVVEDRSAMMPFPPVLPDPSWRFTARVPRDHYVRVATCDYSVHPRAIGRRVEVQATVGEVLVRLDGQLVAQHQRSLVKHRTITDPAHDAARKVMIAFAAALADDHPDEVEQRDLTVYDRILGVA
jgi:transposase